jgi:uncharacterized BrkB/YihY/UPF0761 family membrane protein
LGLGEGVINIFVVLLLAAILLPIAFTQIFNANTVGWDSNTVTIFGLLPVIASVALILILVYQYYERRG